MKRVKNKKNKIYNKIEWKTDIRVYVWCEKNQARKHLLTNALVNITVTVFRNSTVVLKIVNVFANFLVSLDTLLLLFK